MAALLFILAFAACGRVDFVSEAGAGADGGAPRIDASRGRDGALGFDAATDASIEEPDAGAKVPPDAGDEDAGNTAPDAGAPDAGPPPVPRRAADSGLPGTFRAILSDAATSARDRLALSGEVRDTAGTLLAASPAELWGGSIRVALQNDERGVRHTVSIVWTGTDVDGVADRSGGHCSSWTSAGGGAEAGRTDESDVRWISIYGAGASGHACSNTSRLYCIRVGP
jgi:hypothetical protein